MAKPKHNNNGKGNKKKIKLPKSLEPLKQDPNYLVNLAQTASRNVRGGTELDPVIPRIIKDLINPTITVDLNFYIPFLLQAPVFGRLCDMLYYLWFINYQQDICIYNYLVQCGMTVGAPSACMHQVNDIPTINGPQWYEAPQQMNMNPSVQVNVMPQQPLYNNNGFFSEPFAQQQQFSNVPQQPKPYVDIYTDLQEMTKLLNTARANECVYLGCRNALVSAYNNYVMNGFIDTTPILTFINQNAPNSRFITFPDFEGPVFFDKVNSMERRNNNHSERRHYDNGRNQS